MGACHVCHAVWNGPKQDQRSNLCLVPYASPFLNQNPARLLKCVPQVHDGAPATLAELAEVEEDLTAGAMQVRVCSICLRMRCPRLGCPAVLRLQGPSADARALVVCAG